MGFKPPPHRPPRPIPAPPPRGGDPFLAAALDEMLREGLIDQHDHATIRGGSFMAGRGTFGGGAPDDEFSCADIFSRVRSGVGRDERDSAAGPKLTEAVHFSCADIW